MHENLARIKADYASPDTWRRFPTVATVRTLLARIAELERASAMALQNLVVGDTHLDQASDADESWTWAMNEMTDETNGAFQVFLERVRMARHLLQEVLP